MGLADNFVELDAFVIDTYTFKDLKYRLVDEFCEVFMLDSVSRNIVFGIVNNGSDTDLDMMRVDIDELKDLANMCFALKLLYDIKNNKYALRFNKKHKDDKYEEVK